MALVCPVDHPPGVGTTFCRLCGRAYLAVEDAVEVLPEPEPVLAAVPELEVHEVPGVPESEEVMAAVQVPVPFIPPPLPPREWPAPQAPSAELVQTEFPSPIDLLPALDAVPHVHLPLVPAQGGPSSSYSVQVQPSVAADEAQPEPDDAPRARRFQLDRSAVLALGGFFGGVASGAAVTRFLT